MAKAAIKDYDKNNNSTIEGAELDAVPGLKNSVANIDKNNDKKLSQDELKGRFEAYKALGAGATGTAVEITLNGTPLEDAAVTFTPEPCMLGVCKTATGTTSANGTVTQFNIDGSASPGLPCGLYKITVSKKDAAGKELVPDRYASATPLGCEIFMGDRGSSAQVSIKLASK